MAKFSVTYEIITPESAENGDCEESGFLYEEIGLREAIDALIVGYCEADEFPVQSPRWITSYGEMNYHDGSVENRSLHIPQNVTDSSKIRIARLCGIKC